MQLCQGFEPGITATQALQYPARDGSQLAYRFGPTMIHVIGMRVVTATMVSAVPSSPKPTSMSAPGQRSRPAPSPDPAPMHRKVGTSEGTRIASNAPGQIVIGFFPRG